MLVSKNATVYYMGTLLTVAVFTAIMFAGLDGFHLNYYLTYGLAYLFTFMLRFYYNCHIVFKTPTSFFILSRLFLYNMLTSIVSAYFIYALETHLACSRITATVLVTCVFIGIQYRLVEKFVFKKA